ncbi:uncharacterized protein LOC141705949 isoform X2 [Apium graveolens]|uniref:uncharacterized protein LOC141705949 isoform X2 n=1 Tax=Apium graveolens TaxID=4045 RepID=UPI003D7BA920
MASNISIDAACARSTLVPSKNIPSGSSSRREMINAPTINSVQRQPKVPPQPTTLSPPYLSIIGLTMSSLEIMFRLWMTRLPSLPLWVMSTGFHLLKDSQDGENKCALVSVAFAIISITMVIKGSEPLKMSKGTSIWAILLLRTMETNRWKCWPCGNRIRRSG